MIIHRYAACGAAALLLGAAAAPVRAQQEKSAPAAPVPVRAAPAVMRAAAVITPETFRARLAVLADDSMAGRKTGTPGNEAAARYLAAQMKRLGLRPAGDAGNYIQRYPLRSVRLDTAGVRLFLGGQREQTLRYGTDYLTARAQSPEATGELLFAGQVPDGALALSGDAKGSIVIFYVPGIPDRAWNQKVMKAAAAAVSAGAGGVLFILDPAFPAATMAVMRGQLEGAAAAPLPCAFLSYPVASAAAAATGSNLDAVRSRSADEALVDTGLRGTLRVPTSVSEVSAPNVVGILPGKDKKLKSEYVVVSAHFDHVGTGKPDAQGDSIFNGADDNASGTVGLLEVARAFREKGARPARSLLFLAVSGEEQGLLGSAYWVAHPTVPAGSVVADVNMDMLARNARDTIAVLGQELSTLGAVVQGVAAAHPELGLVVPTGNPWPSVNLITMSDQLPFLQAGIPGVFFFSGMHPDLHGRGDDLAHADPDKASRAARLVFLLTHAVASEAQRPELTEAGKQLGKASH